MTITLNDVSARADYTASAGQTVYPLTFKFFAATDLLVFVNGTQKALTTDYTAQGINADTGMQITLVVASTAGDKVSIIRAVPYARLAQLPISGPFQVGALNDFLTQLVAMIQQVRDKAVAAIGLDLATNSFFDAVSKRIANVATPTAATDAANKAYVDANPTAAAYASAAAGSATASASSATASASSATAANTSALAAANAYAQTMAAFTNFDDRYLGASATAPTKNHDNTALIGGALYYDTTQAGMFVWTGSAWMAAYVQGSNYLPIHGTADAAASVNTGNYNSIFAYGSVGFVIQSATGSTSTQLQFKWNAGATTGGYLYADQYGMTFLNGSAQQTFHIDADGTITAAGGLNVNKAITIAPDTSNLLNIGRFSSAYGGSAINFNGGATFCSFQFGGTEKARLDASGNLSVVGSISDAKGDVRKIIQNPIAATYTAVLADAGKSLVGTNASTNVTIPANVFGAGDAITIVNYNTGTNFTITQGTSLSLVLASNATLTLGNRTLASNGMCTLLFLNATTAYISGAGLT